MIWKEFYDKLKNGIVFSDGAMGVFLQKYGLKDGNCPELWNLTNPDVITGIHREYIEAGCDLIITNTLGGNRIKLSHYGLENRIKEINNAAVLLAKKAAGSRAIVAGDVGPTGVFVSPLGSMSFDEMADIYKEQIEALAEAGADCIIFETHIDILELKAGIVACREVCNLPVIASVTFEKDGRMVTGSLPDAAFTTLEGLGVDIIGTNCGTGPEDMLNVIDKIKGSYSIPIIAQANAGMPRLFEGKTVFNESPESFAISAVKMAELGVNVIGGCCGTTPEHIKVMRDSILKQKSYLKHENVEPASLKISSRYIMHKIGFDFPFTVIGERLNPTARKSLATDIIENRYQLFKEEALSQEKAGAGILDMNMGIPGADESALVSKGIEVLSTGVQIPVSIDSSNSQAARLGIKLYPGKPLLNSISAESDRLALLKDVRKYGAAFIALPIDENGIPKTAEARVKLMQKIIEQAEKECISRENILADPLVLTVSAEQDGAAETLKTLRLFREKLGLFTTIGLSNVSYGLPARGYVNRSFLSMAIANGLTSAIVNPFDEELMGLVRASDVLLGKDKNSQEYIRLYSGKPNISPSQSIKEKNTKKESFEVPVDTGVDTIENKLYQAVLKGNKEVITERVKSALDNGINAYKILNDYLIPAITQVGFLYDKRTYFLPQLMLSAETMKEAFKILEPILREQNNEPKGKVLIATVKGDVHDIGKNIVVLMLKNHGLDVIDLGKDVSNNKILEEAVKYKPDIIGLSALMTTTMPKMKEFMELMKKQGLKYPVMIGGAAVTRNFADSIGANYASDAVDAVRKALSLIKNSK